MKNKIKKWILPLGSLTMLVVPVASVLACGFNEGHEGTTGLSDGTPTVIVKEGYKIQYGVVSIGLETSGTDLKIGTTFATLKVEHGQDPRQITDEQFKDAFIFKDDKDGTLDHSSVVVQGEHLTKDGGDVKIIATDSNNNKQIVDLEISVLSA